MILPPRRIMLSTTRNIWCLVDAKDYDWCMQWSWNYGWHRNTPWKFYAKRNVGRERSTLYLHRELKLHIDFPTDLKLVVDHDNGQSLDNRRQNLNWVTRGYNSAHVTPRAMIPKLNAIERAHAQTLQDIPF